MESSGSEPARTMIIDAGTGPTSHRTQAWLSHHLRSARAALLEFRGAKWSTFATVVALSIALCLPTILTLVAKDLSGFVGRWNLPGEVTFFFRDDVDEQAQSRIMSELLGHPAIAELRTVDARENYRDFLRLSGVVSDVDELLSGSRARSGGLPENPFPDSVVAKLTADASKPVITNLVNELADRPDVEFVQFDALWYERAQYLVEVLRRASIGLAVVFCLGLVLIVGNTIRLAIDLRRAEIEIAQLCGATRAFVRRPFLYTGAYLGVTSAVGALVIVIFLESIVASPLNALVTIYDDTNFTHLTWGLDAASAIVVLVGGISIGIVGAWIAVWRHLE
jgi:cell division transport system permease protein